jgi:hypothetical protein
MWKTILFIILFGISKFSISQFLTEEQYKIQTQLFIVDSLMKGNQGIYEKPLITRGSRYLCELKHNINHKPDKKFLGKYIIYCKDLHWEKIKNSLEKYALNVQSKFNVDILIYSVDNETPEELKSTIKKESTNLKGVTFIGDISAAWFEIHDDFYEKKYSQFPCDLFYMDLDGDWKDIDSNGLYDEHDGNQQPEIFVARIHPYFKSKDESEELTKFFTKNNRYYSMNYKDLNYKSFAFVDQDWQVFEDHKNDIRFVHGKNNYTHANPEKNGVKFNEQLYINTLTGQHGMIQFNCHSSATSHYLSDGSVISSQKIFNTKINAVSMNLFCCSALNWKAKLNLSPLMGAAYLFGNNNVQCLTGSTKIGSMLNFNHFYQPLGVGKCFGDAFVDWWHNGIEENHTSNTRSWHYGLSIFGDPMIQLGKQNYYSGNSEDLITISTPNENSCTDGRTYVDLEAQTNVEGEIIWNNGRQDNQIEVRPNKSTDYKLYVFDDDGNGYVISKRIDVRKPFNCRLPKKFYVRKKHYLEIDARSYSRAQKIEENYSFNWSCGGNEPLIKIRGEKDIVLKLTISGACRDEIVETKIIVLSSLEYFIRRYIFFKNDIY